MEPGYLISLLLVDSCIDNSLLETRDRLDAHWRHRFVSYGDPSSGKQGMYYSRSHFRSYRVHTTRNLWNLRRPLSSDLYSWLLSFTHGRSLRLTQRGSQQSPYGRRCTIGLSLFLSLLSCVPLVSFMTYTRPPGSPSNFDSKSTLRIQEL